MSSPEDSLLWRSSSVSNSSFWAFGKIKSKIYFLDNFQRSYLFRILYLQNNTYLFWKNGSDIINTLHTFSFRESNLIDILTTCREYNNINKNNKQYYCLKWPKNLNLKTIIWDKGAENNFHIIKHHKWNTMGQNKLYKSSLIVQM